jgi:hypothetical protein
MIRLLQSAGQAWEKNMKSFFACRVFGLACLQVWAGLLFIVGGCGIAGIPGDGSEVAFVVRIENVSEEDTLQASDGTLVSLRLSPGVWVVHDQQSPLFTEGEPDEGLGLESIAEDGDPTPASPARPFSDVLLEKAGVKSSGVFETAQGAFDSYGIGPGGAYEFVITAAPDDSLSFATRFAPSNDLFLAPDEDGIDLFDESKQPISGDVPGDQIILWDAGTEDGQESGVVARVEDVSAYPSIEGVIRVTITPQNPILLVLAGLSGEILNVLIQDLVSGVFNLPSAGGF